MNRVLSIKPKLILSISCNPATLSRDLKTLSNKYDIESIKLVDFFPQTYHIESLTSLRLK